jgi:hypothetical protein
MIPAKNQAVSAPPASPQPSSSQSDTMMGAPELLNDAKFKSAYYKELGPKVKESWLAKLDGPAPLVKKSRWPVRSTYLPVSARTATVKITTQCCCIRLKTARFTVKSSTGAGRR